MPSSNFGLEAIPRSRVYSEVARQLQDHIVHHLKAGDMLPPERELVQRFGVSRNSIRDAIRSLEAMGWLEPRHGVGTVVRGIPAEGMVAPVANALLQKRKAISDLLEFRMIVEPALASRAARHATAEQVAEMEAVLDRQQERLEQGETTTGEDSAFHYAIALAAGNGVMLKLARVLMDLLRETRERSLQSEARQRKSLAGHRRILQAIREGDAKAAESAMRRHLSEVEQIVLQKF